MYYIKKAKLLNFKLLQHDNKLYFYILKNTKKSTTYHSALPTIISINCNFLV